MPDVSGGELGTGRSKALALDEVHPYNPLTGIMLSRPVMKEVVHEFRRLSDYCNFQRFASLSTKEIEVRCKPDAWQGGLGHVVTVELSPNV